MCGAETTPAFSSHPVGIAALSLKGSNSSTCGGNGELDPSYSASNVDETPGSPPFARTGASAGVSIRGIVPEVAPLVLSRARFAFRCGAPTGGGLHARSATLWDGGSRVYMIVTITFIPTPRRLSAPLESTGVIIIDEPAATF